jgi:hypothetical protein
MLEKPDPFRVISSSKVPVGGKKSVRINASLRKVEEAFALWDATSTVRLTSFAGSPPGTLAMISLVDIEIISAGRELKYTFVIPRLKLFPEIVTCVFTLPLVGVKDAMDGGLN